MIGHEVSARTGEDVVRLVRALGQHRYVASRLHLVHVFAIDAAATASEDPGLADAGAWARRLLDANVLDLASKDERLHRRATDAELTLVLSAFWGAGEARGAARERLAAHLAAIDVAADETGAPFDESREDDVFPALVDAGWELLPLADLDAERHKGAIGAFDDFEVARFEEESAVPRVATLTELPMLGALELLAAVDDEGRLRAPFVVWTEGHETYLDYVLRGVLRAAKLPAPEEP